jgi:hypothetical protein
MSPPWFVRGGPNLSWARFGWSLLHCGEQFCTDVHCKRKHPPGTSHYLKAAPHRKCSVAMERCHGRCETLPRFRGRVPVGGQDVPTRLPKHACFYRHFLAFAGLPGRGDRRAACWPTSERHSPLGALTFRHSIPAIRCLMALFRESCPHRSSARRRRRTPSREMVRFFFSKPAG